MPLEELNNEYKYYNNNYNYINISSQNELENFKNKRYNDISTARLYNPNNEKPSTLNQKKYFPYEEQNFNNIYNELGIKKGTQKLPSKKIAFIGVQDKKAKLLFYENKNNLKFNNNMNTFDKKMNLKPLAEIKEKNNVRKRNNLNQVGLLYNKNFSSVELRPNNNALTQNDAPVNDNNIILQMQQNINDNKINISEMKETRNKSTAQLIVHENKNINSPIDFKKNGKILKLKNQNQKREETNNDIAKNNPDLKINVKNLTSKEKACILLTQSKILQLPERIIFSRASENVKSLIPIKDIISSNEIFLKQKMKQIQFDLINYNKKLETPFTPSKTADISLNIIKKEDEDLFKDLINNYQNLEENEQKYYKTYLCLLYILLGEDLKQIKYENINSNLLFDKLNKKGYENFKDYLYINFIKQKTKILNDDKLMDKFDELYITLPDLIKQPGIIKNNKFIHFSYFLIKEIYEYRKNLKRIKGIKNRTKDYLDILKKKCPS